MWKLSPSLYIEMFCYQNNSCLQVKHLLGPEIKFDFQINSFCLCLPSLCFSHSLTLLYMISYFYEFGQAVACADWPAVCYLLGVSKEVI